MELLGKLVGRRFSEGNSDDTYDSAIAIDNNNGCLMSHIKTTEIATLKEKV